MTAGIDDLIPLLEEHLPRLRAQGSSEVLMASDGDCTLWHEDIGEALFRHALEAGVLKPAARAALAAEAWVWGVDGSGDDPNEIARRLFVAHVEGRYPSRPAYAMMAWAFAGFRPAELAALCEEVLDAFDLAGKQRASLVPVLRWAEAQAVPFWLVSASPLAVVEAAARRLGLDVSRVLAMTPELAGDVLAPRLARTATYAEGKLHRLREVSAGPLLAGFGDSDYDGALLEAAAVAVAVAPKAELRARMARREGPVVIVEA